MQVLLLLLLVLSAVITVIPANAEDSKILRLMRLSVDEGLSEGYVNNMLIDSDGFLWLATESGLNRYDGYEVEQIPGPDGIFKDSRVPYLFQDSFDLMWISHVNSGLYSLDLNTREYTKHLDENMLGAPSEIVQVSYIAEQDNGNLWLASTQNLRLYHRQSGRIEVIFSIAKDDNRIDIIRSLLIHNEYLYIATSIGLYVLNINTRQIEKINHTPFAKPNENQNNTKSLHLYGDELLVGTVEGLFSINISNIQAVIDKEETQFTPKEHVTALNIWRMLPYGEHMYLGTDQGLYFYEHSTGKQYKLWEFSDDRKFEVTDNNIVDIKVDAKGHLWLASRVDGAFYWDPKASAFHSIHRRKFGFNQLSDNLAWSVHQAKDGAMWVGTQNGLNKVDLKTENVTSYLISDDKKAIQNDGTIYKIMEDSQGVLWLMTGDFDNRLVSFDPKTGKKRTVLLSDKKAAEAFSKPGITFHLDKDDVMWFVTRDGFFRYDTKNGSVSDVTGLNEALRPEFTTGFLGSLPGREDSIMVATYGQLWLYDIERNQARLIYNIPNFKPQDYTTPETWTVDKNNTLWISIAQYGLVGLDADTFEPKYEYNQSNKLPSDIVYGVQQDAVGDLWFSSHHGMARLDGETHHLEQFTTKDGLATNEFNGGAAVNSYARLNDGRLAYASMLGVTLFDPNELKQQQVSINDVKITKLGLLSRDLVMPLKDLSGTHLPLDYHDIGLQINFSTLDFGKDNKTRFRFELSGTEPLKYPETTENSILFPQLQPGEHRFSVVAIDAKTGLESEKKFVTIAVGFAWWASPLAYSFYVLIILVCVFMWSRKRQLNEEKLLNAHKTVVRSEERLRLALEGSRSGVWDWQAEHNMMFEQRVNGLLGYIDLPKYITLIQHVDLIHPNDRCDFESAWAMFITNPEKNFDCTYRMKGQNGEWFWFHDLGMVAEKNDLNKPLRITGTYTNITDTKASEEQARLFGEAFKQTRDWVIILDVYQQPMAANQSFREAFGLVDCEQLPEDAYEVMGIDRNKRNHYTEILNDLESGKHWIGEEVVVSRDGKVHPVVMSMNSVAGKGDEVAFFVLVLTDITAQKAAENDLRQLANYDSLTGLPNRALLLDRIKHAIEHAKRYKFKMALFFIDLDRFKQVNDSLGHDVGDLLLIDVARRLKSVLREGDTVARLGGDEFVILLESYHHIEDVSHVAEKVILQIDQPIELGDDVVSVSPSIGISLYPEDATVHTELLKNADVAMYHAKKAGRNNFQYFTSEMNERAKAKLEQENAIKQAFLNEEFVNFYQPIVDVSSNRVKGFEVLMRWQTDEGIVPPYRFISVAEDIGLIVKMTQDLLKRGLDDLRKWHEMGYSPYLSVNLSVKDLEQESLATDCEALLIASGLPASSVRFEITESALMTDIDKAIDTMNRLTELGFVLALDDFGTGYSSLKYLKEFPIEIIKIDRGFVKDIGIDNNDEAIIDSIIVMANSLGMKCIAEGVETDEQLAFLTERKCSWIQGYYFSQPVPFDGATGLLQKDFNREVDEV